MLHACTQFPPSRSSKWTASNTVLCQHSASFHAGGTLSALQHRAFHFSTLDDVQILSPLKQYFALNFSLTSTLLSPTVLLSTLFSVKLSCNLRFSLKVRVRVFQQEVS